MIELKDLKPEDRVQIVSTPQKGLHLLFVGTRNLWKWGVIWERQ